MATGHFIHGSQVRKAWRANLQTVRLVGAVAHDVDAELAFRMLDGGVSLAFGHVETFGEQLEVMNQLFHVGLHRLTVGRSDLVVAGNYRAGIHAQPVHALLDDAVRLAHFFNAHQIAVIAVTGLADRNVEIHLAVNLIRLLLAQVPGEAGTAKHRAGKSEIERALWRDDPDTDGALLPDPVVGEQCFVLIHIARKLVGEILNEVQQRPLAVFVERFNRLGVLDLADFVLRHALRQITVNAARTVIGRMHARARHGFVHVKQRLTLAKAVNQDVHRAAIKAVRAQPQQMIEQARDFIEHHADVLRPNRHIHTDQFFNGETVGMLV